MAEPLRCPKCDATTFLLHEGKILCSGCGTVVVTTDHLPQPAPKGLSLSPSQIDQLAEASDARTDEVLKDAIMSADTALSNGCPEHPGYYISAWAGVIGLDIGHVADIVACGVESLQHLYEGRRPLTTADCNNLADIFPDTTDQWWQDLQDAYDRSQETLPPTEVSEVIGYAPYRAGVPGGPQTATEAANGERPAWFKMPEHSLQAPPVGVEPETPDTGTAGDLSTENERLREQLDSLKKGPELGECPKECRLYDDCTDPGSKNSMCPQVFKQIAEAVKALASEHHTHGAEGEETLGGLAEDIMGIDARVRALEGAKHAT